MKISSTFVPGLLSFWFDDQTVSEFVRLLRLWSDVEYLEGFFVENESDLEYFDNISIETAVRETKKELQKFEDFFIEIATENKNLSQLFKPLDDNEFRKIELSQQKASRRWLRLYAIKVDEDTFIITGGTIKLTKKLEDRLHGQLEIAKLNKCKKFLQSEGVFDADSFYDFYLE